jgi:hypothetical protein
MGLVVFAFIKSGILPIALPDVASAPEKAAFFVLAVAFVSGFSERLVQDLLSAAETDPRFGARVRGPAVRGSAVPESAVPRAAGADAAN